MKFYTAIEPRIRSWLEAHPRLEPEARLCLMQAMNLAGEGLLALAVDVQCLAATAPAIERATPPQLKPLPPSRSPSELWPDYPEMPVGQVRAPKPTTH